MVFFQALTRVAPGPDIRPHPHLRQQVALVRCSRGPSTIMVAPSLAHAASLVSLRVWRCPSPETAPPHHLWRVEAALP